MKAKALSFETIPQFYWKNDKKKGFEPLLLIFKLLFQQTVFDGVHCRESAITGPVNLKVVLNECCLGRSRWPNQNAPLFPTPTLGMKWAC